MRVSRLALGLIAGGLLLVADSGLARAPELTPAGISLVAAGDLILLDSRLGLFHVVLSSGKIRRLVDGFGIYEGVGMGVFTVGSGESIFVNQVPRVSGIGALLVQYNLEGKKRAEWKMPPWKGRCSGIVIDQQTSTAYVASTETGEIFRFDLQKPDSLPKPLAGISQAEFLDSLALDGKRHRVLAADVALGLLFAVDLETGKSVRLAKGLGEPSALALDAKADQLFIADAAKGRIWSLDLSDLNAKPRVFAKDLEEPMALGLASDGTLWVGDSDSRRLFQISREGKVLREVELKFLKIE